jgi:hypothetical protein
MTDQDNDDEIRESIPCVTVVTGNTVLCLPVGYGVDHASRVSFRGKDISRLWATGAWDHAIEREKARRAKAKDARRAVHAERLREIAYMLEAFAELRDEGETCGALYGIARMIETGELP